MIISAKKKSCYICVCKAYLNIFFNVYNKSNLIIFIIISNRKLVSTDDSDSSSKYFKTTPKRQNKRDIFKKSLFDFSSSSNINSSSSDTDSDGNTSRVTVKKHRRM